MRNTRVISGFPGIGKSTACNILNSKGKVALDSNSSYFNKDNFPGNYIKYIQEYIYVVDYIFISSHKDVREALQKAGIMYYAVYPNVRCKNVYLDNYRKRGNSADFIQMLDENWSEWISDMGHDNTSYNIELGEGTYLMNLLNIAEQLK